MFKWNNSYGLYLINRIYWKIKNHIAKRNLNKTELIRFKRRQSECIWCKRIHVRRSNFCSSKCKNLYADERYQSFKHNNRCQYHKFQKLTYKNQCWSCYKEEQTEMKIPKMKGSFLLRMHGFKTIPTFRTSKDNWNGNKIAFEQFLYDNNVRWFVYVKFYKGNGSRIKPIVVGKSGSIKVNASGSDLNFSTAFNDGTARQFMHYNKFEWHYDHIMIRKCRSESKAYSLETKIMNKFDLFGS